MGVPPAEDAAQRWATACALDELPTAQPRALLIEGHHIALVRLAEDVVHGIEDRCPYEGQPLADGRVEGATLVCAHHDHRFELESGASVHGDEDVLSYATRVVDGRVEVMIAPSDPDAELERRAKSLKEALVGGRLAQAARDVSRMLSAKVDPVRVVLEIAAFDALHNEHGCGPALPLASDVLRISSRYAGLDAVMPCLHVVEAAMASSKHRAPRRVPPSQDPGREPEGIAERLVKMLEADDPDAADGLVRGALWRKWGREVIEPWFFELNAAHFLGDGDGLSYTIKTFDLLEAAGFEHARRLLPGLTYGLASMTRSDTLPAWQWFRQRYAQLEPRLTELWTRAGQRALDGEERSKITAAILDGSREEAWHAVIGALVSGAKIDSVIDALSRAAAERLWRFDAAIDRNPAASHGWADVARPLVYAHALRAASQRYRKPGLIKLVLYGVRLVHDLAPLDMPADRWTAIDTKGRVSLIDRERLLVDLVEMVHERSPVEAQRAALAYLALGGSLDALRARLYDLVLRDLFVSPAMSALAIELTVAACDETMVLPDADRSWPLRALIRMLASPMRERSLERVALRARRAVE